MCQPLTIKSFIVILQSIKIYFLCQWNASQHVWLPHMIMSKIHARGKEHGGRIELLLSNARIWLLWFFISWTGELFKQIAAVLSGEAVFMVYLQLREFRWPARGCSWKTVPKTFRVPRPLVLSWPSDIPAQCHQPQVCLSSSGRAITRRGIIDIDYWYCLLIFFSRHVVLCRCLDWGSAPILLQYELSLIQDPLKSSKAFKWAVWNGCLSHDAIFANG